MRFGFFAAFLCVLFAPSVAISQAIEPGQEGELANFLKPVPGAHVCYGRVYSDQHLAKHPKQKVTEVGFRLAYHRFSPDQTYPQGQRNYYFAMTARTRGQARTMTAIGECGPNGDSIGCGVECDGGGVSVTRRPGDKILVTLGPGGRIRMTAGCGDEETDSVDLEAGEDDHEFLLSRLPDAACPAYERW